jgi:hypothetical protein
MPSLKRMLVLHKKKKIDLYREKLIAGPKRQLQPNATLRSRVPPMNPEAHRRGLMDGVNLSGIGRQRSPPLFLRPWLLSRAK